MNMQKANNDTDKARRLASIKNALKKRKLKIPAKMELFNDAHLIRNIESVAKRAIVSAIIAKLAYDLYESEDRASLIVKAEELLDQYDASDALFADEIKVLTQPYDEALCNNIGWQYECANALLWSLGLTEDDDPGFFLLDVDTEISRPLSIITQYQGFSDFLASCKMRSEEELADAYQLYWQYNWCMNDARIHGDFLPFINYDVVVERRRALQWLVYSDYDENGEWANIEMNT